MPSYDFNVKSAPYSAKGDAIRCLDAITANGSDIVQIPSAPFIGAGDVGKVIWANDPVFGPTLGQTTIKAAIDSSHVQVNAPATVNGTNVCCVFGTDDTAAFQAAFAAVVAAVKGSISGRILIPGSGYICSARWYRNNGTALQNLAPMVVGDGKEVSQLYLAPSLTIPGDGTPVVMEGVGTGVDWRGLTIDGCYSIFATAAGQTLVSLAQAASMRVADFDIRNVGIGAGSFMIGFQGLRQFQISDVVAQNLGILGAGGAMAIDDCQGTFLQCFASNTLANLRFTNNNGRSTLSTPLNWIGGGSDEGGTPACSLVNSIVNMQGIVNFCGIDPPSVAFDVDGTSRLYIEDSNVGRFLGYAGQNRPVNIRAGGMVISKGTTWRGNVVPPGSPTKFMVNAGTFLDIGGNDYRRYSADDVYTVATPADCFDGHQPLVNGSWYPYAQVPR